MSIKEIKTIIHIHAPRELVWKTLMNFDEYPDWNPFIRSIRGVPSAGHPISVTLKPPGSKRAVTLKPQVLTFDQNREFRWRGHLFMNGLFDGEHFFLLDQLPNGSTAVHHGEQFSGLLLPLMDKMLKKTETGFQQMNMALKARCEKNGPENTDRRG